jgi:hypothetical protein
MNPKIKILLVTIAVFIGVNVSGQITKSLYVQSPCTATLISEKKVLSENDLAVFPNPSDGFFKIQFSSIIYNEEIRISVINGLGQKILDKNAEVKDNSIEIDLRGSSKGIYMIRLITGKNIILKKFIISF